MTASDNITQRYGVRLQNENKNSQHRQRDISMYCASHTTYSEQIREGDGRERLAFSTIDELKQTSQCKKEEKTT